MPVTSTTRKKILSPLLLPDPAVKDSASVWEHLRKAVEAHRDEAPDKELLSPSEISRLTSYSAVEYLLGCGQ